MLPLGTVNIFARHFGFTRDTDALAAAIAAGHRGTVGHLDSREQSLAGRVASRLGAGDLLVTLGAGDITRSGPEILALLEG